MKRFITPQQLKKELPLLRDDLLASHRETIINILTKEEQRLLLIVGPCSIHNVAAAYAYAKRLLGLSGEVQDVFFIVMRTYFEKPRTTVGWKGLVYDPFLDGSNDMQEGIRQSRRFLLELADMGLATACEFLEPLIAPYLSDCISWGSIGARTCQSPIHRQLAAHLPMPVGIKNRSDGNIDIAIQAIITAMQPHHFVGLHEDGTVCEIEAKGNSFPHLVLRGGENQPNWDPLSIETARAKLARANLPQALIVDCSHDNSQKNYMLQPEIFSAIIEQFTTGTQAIRGCMLESFLEAGAEMMCNAKDGQSVTDPCLDWQTTEKLIRHAAEVLRQRVPSCV